ncbi:MAG: DUF6716 putative glycosyltransferase [Verrucomicrobiota bacterium]
MKRVCLIFDSDSQFFACRNVAATFKRGNWAVTYLALAQYNPPAELIDPGFGRAGVEFVEDVATLPEILRHDVIGAYLPGSKLRRLHLLVANWFDENQRRPVLFTGYNGVVLMKFEEGMGWRTGYDFVALNSPEDDFKAKQFLSHCAPPRSTPTPIIGIDRKKIGAPWQPAHDPSWYQKKRLIFAEQVLFPRSDVEKSYLYSHLVRIALENPEWEIVIKPRTMPDGVTFHRQSTHISSFLTRRFVFPPNLSVSYENLDQQMARSTALISISSTAFFDAIGSGLPGFILSDFGIKNDYGTHFFHGSGCSLCLSEIGALSHELFARRPTDEWLHYKGFDPKFSADLLAASIDAALADGIHLSPPEPCEAEQRLLGHAAILPVANTIKPRLTWRRFKKSLKRGYQNFKEGPWFATRQNPADADNEVRK